MRQPIDPAKYRHCSFIGINLSMVQPIEEWCPFDVLIERDSNRQVRPDLTFLLDRERRRPVFGLCIIDRQPEYGMRQKHSHCRALFQWLCKQHDAAVVEIDTGWPGEMNETGLSSEAQIETLIARTDVVLTNRLHGMVYAIRSGVPALVLDPVEGGGKVSAQAKVLGWPFAFVAGSVRREELQEPLSFCLSEEGKTLATACARNAKKNLSGIREEFISALNTEPLGMADKWPEKRIIKKPFAHKLLGVCKRYMRVTGEYLLKRSAQ